MRLRNWIVLSAIALGISSTAALPTAVRSATTSVRFIEPSKLYTEEAMQPVERALVAFAYRFAALGDTASAIEAMQTAANRLVRRRNANFELWDNLAELYCVAARRERDPKRAAALRSSGLALVREFRCASDFYTRGAEGMPCYAARGVAPNPIFSPLCFRLFCAPGSRDVIPQEPGDENPDAGIRERRQSVLMRHSASYREDAANVSAIERGCRATEGR
jgi:hypothetical protein